MNLGSFFKNLTSVGETWGGYFIMFLGMILVIVAIIQLVKAFLQHGRGQSNWLMIALMILVGGYLFATGFNGVKTFADFGQQTLKDIANGTTTVK